MAVFQGPGSLFIPNFQASGKLQVEYTRRPDTFKVNQWAKMVPTAAPAGYWLYTDTSDANRVINANTFAWADGNEAPQGVRDSFTWNSFQCQRFAYPVTLGNQAIQTADIDLIAQSARLKAQQAMTFRTYKLLSLALTASNWATQNVTHYGTATSLGGGVWAASSASNMYIRKTLEKVRNNIVLDTQGAVSVNDLQLVVDPVGAAILTDAPEIQQYLINNPVSYAALNIADRAMFDAYGLPPFIYGFKVVVEDCVVNTAQRDATVANKFLMNNNVVGTGSQNCVALVTSRPGGLIGIEGVPSFATLTNFVYGPDDMTIETMNDPNNRRTACRVVDNFAPVLTSAASGYLITNIDS